MNQLVICGGAQKAGTSWLFRCLQENKKIACAYSKEVHFFSSKYDSEKLEEYRAEFPNHGESNFEASTSYISDTEAAGRIHSHYPDAKLLFILRDPVERAFSHFLHLKNTNKTDSTSTLDAVKKHPEIIANSSYGVGLKRYYETFPTDSILLVDFAHISSDPASVINRVCEFIGIDIFTPTILEKKYHSSEARSNSLYKKTAKIYWKLKNNIFGRMFITFCRKIGFNHVFLDSMLQKFSTKKPELNAHERETLQKFFIEDQKILRDIVERHTNVTNASYLY